MDDYIINADTVDKYNKLFGLGNSTLMPRAWPCGICA